MKGHKEIIARLNFLLADELTAINQYMVHSEMCADWGYERLHQAVEKRAIDEMKHAERLIGRIIFLEDVPIVSELNPIHIGPEIEQRHPELVHLDANGVGAQADARGRQVRRQDGFAGGAIPGVLLQLPASGRGQARQ